jgi:hypothetical protein
LFRKKSLAWFRESESTQHRDAKINALTAEDGFRSQFRAGEIAPRSPIEIIEWGLQHVERLRKTDAEAQEQKTKKWASLWVPILSSVIALTAVISGAYLQIRNNRTQVELKRYEVTYRGKQESYASFMKYLFGAFEGASKRNNDLLVKSLDGIEATYVAIEPLIRNSEREEIRQRYQQFTAFCYDIRDKLKDPQKNIDNEAIKTFTDYRGYFRAKLFESLFSTQAQNGSNEVMYPSALAEIKTRRTFLV